MVQPQLEARGLHLTPIILSTQRAKDGRKFRGALIQYSKLRRELLLLLGDSSAAAVTTMVDYYGLPEEFPGLRDLPSGDPCRRVAHLEESLRREIGDSRFLPYLSLHEFEALVLTGPDELAEGVPGSSGVEKKFRDLLASFTSTEEVNDGESTHPSARLKTHLPRYQKTVHGPLVTQRIGLPRLRAACPHFDSWIEGLEELAGAGPREPAPKP